MEDQKTPKIPNLPPLLGRQHSRSWGIGALIFSIGFASCTATSTSTTEATGVSLKSQMAQSATITSGSLITQNYSFAFYDNKDGAWNRDTSDTVSFKATSDADCATASTGTFTMAINPMTTVQGRAELIAFAYLLPDTTESSIYIKATATTAGVSACSKEFKVLHPWRKLLGFTLFTNSGTGVAGATGASQADQARAIVIDSSNRRWIFGTSAKNGGGTALAIWRYLPNGDIDTTFGTAGAKVLSTTGAAGATGASQSDSVAAVKVDSDSRFWIFGHSANAAGGTQAVVWRLGSDGALDTTFGSAGVFTLTGDPGTAGAAGAAVLDRITSVSPVSLGGYWVSGSSANAAGGTEAVVWKLSSAGAIVTLSKSGTTGAAGATGAATLDVAQRVLEDSGGGIWVVGTSKSQVPGTQLVVWKRDSSLTLSTTYGISLTGVWTSGPIGAAGATGTTLLERVGDATIDTSGRLVIAGSSRAADGSERLAVWRLGATTGQLDPGFGNGGILVGSATGGAGATSTNVVDQGQAVRTDAQGRIWVAGNSKNSAGGVAAAIWRSGSDGSLDSSYGSSGALTLMSTTGFAGAPAASSNDRISAALIESVGTSSTTRWMLGGSSANAAGGSEMMLFRISSEGTLDK